jgi:hypothetical protein
MSSIYIPHDIGQQLSSKFNTDFTVHERMLPRKFSCNGTQGSILIKFPIKKSNFVMTAEILVANAIIPNEWRTSVKTPMAFQSGTRIIYQFSDWSNAGEFIDRLPRRMPSNKVTVLVSAHGNPMSIYDFHDHIDHGCFDYHCTHEPLRGLKKLKDELRDFGIAA